MQKQLMVKLKFPIPIPSSTIFLLYYKVSSISAVTKKAKAFILSQNSEFHYNNVYSGVCLASPPALPFSSLAK
jgi:hypothetical protein